MEGVNFLEGCLEDGNSAAFVGSIGSGLRGDDYIGKIVKLSVFLFIHHSTNNNKFIIYWGLTITGFFPLPQSRFSTVCYKVLYLPPCYCGCSIFSTLCWHYPSRESSNTSSPSPKPSSLICFSPCWPSRLPPPAETLSCSNGRRWGTWSWRTPSWGKFIDLSWISHSQGTFSIFPIMKLNIESTMCLIIIIET